MIKHVKDQPAGLVLIFTRKVNSMNPFFINIRNPKNRSFPLGFEKEYKYYDIEASLDQRYRNHQLRLAWNAKMIEWGNSLVAFAHHVFNPTYAPKQIHAKVIASHRHGHR